METDTIERAERDRLLFYAGLAMLIVGGPGLLFAAVAHDPFQIPVGGTAYEVFGPLHVPYLVAGALLVFVGVVLWRVAFRGGVASDVGGDP